LIGAEIAEAYEAREFGKAVRLAMAFADQLNRQFDAARPWDLVKEPAQREALQRICSSCLRGFQYLTLWLKPILPALAGSAEEFLGCGALHWQSGLTPLKRIGAYTHLMQRVEKRQLDALFAPLEATPIVAEATARPLTTPAASPREANALATISIDEFTRVDLRVARILAAEEVPGSDKLLRLTLDVGEPRRREVLAGIRTAYRPEDLIGKLTVLVANLAPRKMKFGTSEGMVLAASADAAKDSVAGIYLLEPDSGARPGMRVK